MSEFHNDRALDQFTSTELDKLRLSQNFPALSEVKPVLTSVVCRKPHRQEFVRVLAGEQNRFNTYCFTEKNLRETYLVNPSLRELIGGDAVPTSLVVALSRNSPIPFLWPLTLPNTDGRACRWHDSAIDAARMAETSWIKVTADMSAGCYATMVATGKLPDPNWSDIPEIKELVKLAFKEHFINYADHPVLKRLRGEV